MSTTVSLSFDDDDVAKVMYVTGRTGISRTELFRRLIDAYATGKITCDALPNFAKIPYRKSMRPR